MRLALALSLVLLAAPAFARNPPGTSGVPDAAAAAPASSTPVPAGAATAPAERAAKRRHPPHAKHPHRTFAQRFEAANTTHDGKLTLTQARHARMAAIVRDFGLIDKKKKGYVTMQDIKAFQAERRALRAADESR